MAWQGKVSTSMRLSRNHLNKGREEPLRYPGKRSRQGIQYRRAKRDPCSPVSLQRRAVRLATAE